MAVTSANTAPALPPAPANALVASNLQARNEIGQLIEQQPDEVARLLRGWLADRRP
jgi:flagellar M-ring protein FliF